MIEIAPSILNADLSDLSATVRTIQQADWIHLDVMDGHFVPNLTFGPMFVSALKKVSSLPVEAHLMVSNPDLLIPLYAAEGCTRVIVHAEATQHLHRLVQRIRELGCQAGVALNPATPLQVLDHVLDDLEVVLIMTVNPGYGGQTLIPATVPKIKTLKDRIRDRQLNCKIEIDGGVNWDNAQMLVENGTDVIVAGTLIYKDPHPGTAVDRLKNISKKGGL